MMYHFIAGMMHQHRINLDLVCTTTFVHALLRRRVIEKSHLKYHLDVFHVAGMVHKIKKKKRSGKLRKNKINMCGVGVALRPLKKKPPNKKCTKFPTRRNCAEYSGQFRNETYPQTFTCKAHSFQTQLIPWLCRVFTADVTFHTTASHLTFLISHFLFALLFQK